MWPLKDWVAVIYTPFIYTLPPAESIKRETGVQGNKYVCTATVGPVCIYKNNSPAQCFSHCFSFHFRAVAQPIKILCHRLLKESRGGTLLWGPSLEVIYFSWWKSNVKDPSCTSLTSVLCFVCRVKHSEICSPYCSYLADFPMRTVTLFSLAIQ